MKEPRHTPLADAEQQHPPRTDKTVLVVDDNVMVLDMIGRVLEPHPVRVLKTSSPDEAEQLLADLPERIDHLITDVDMPTVSGPELARTARYHRPNIGLLFVTGVLSARLRRDLPKGSRVLSKPFSTRQLCDVVLG